MQSLRNAGAKIYNFLEKTALKGKVIYEMPLNYLPNIG